ncbi:TonB family protein [Sulfurimonas sp. SAG-AH-194-C20]|nr:energy transducer TonB [Sulfurimonas sp. SAG-AH-194-C20]MDF1878844.1 TonB family protein [Sulfurimonas sp. SAG-AH-194-C20]
MIRHSNSFIVSIIIHLLLVVLIYLVYKEVSIGLKVEKKESLLCIKLSSVCKPTQKTLAPPKKPKKLIKKKKKVKPLKKVAQISKLIVEIQNKKVLVEKEVLEDTSTLKKTSVIKKVQKKDLLTLKVVKEKSAPQKIYIDENIEKIIALIKENLYYPRRARKRGIQGNVLVRFTLSKAAKVSNIEVLSSNSNILSRGAIKTIQNIDEKLPKPNQNITFNIPISYTLH